MKKVISSLAVLALCSASAFAQGYYLEFDPAMGTVLESRDYTVRATLTDEAKAEVPEAAGALVQPIGGYGFSQEGYEPFVAEMAGDVISIELKDEMWGIPFNKMYHIQLLVVLTDKEGTPLMDEVTDDFIMDMSAYMCPDTGAAQFVRSYPNNDWNGVSFAKAYEYGECKLFYTKEVDTEDVLGTIQYFDPDGVEYDDPINIESYTAEWSEMDGLYVISFRYASVDYTANEISKIVIDITGVSTGNKTIVLTNSAISPRKKVNKGIGADFSISEEPLSIFTIQGSMVKGNITNLSDLEKGIYIINGKKVIIK